jgi:hypothetical protein
MDPVVANKGWSGWSLDLQRGEGGSVNEVVKGWILGDLQRPDHLKYRKRFGANDSSYCRAAEKTQE